MNRIQSSLSIAALAATVVAPGLAAASEVTNAYPRLSGDASSQHVEYAPGSSSNVVGGGVAVFTGVNDGRPEFSYGRVDVQHAATAPVFIGTEDGRPVFAYVPVAQAGSQAVAGGISARGPRG